MNTMLYRRYWARVNAQQQARGSGVRFSWSLRGDQPYGTFIDYNPLTPGTLPEKMVYSALEKRGVAFYYGYYFGDIPFTDNEEHYRADFILPDYNLIIEIQGAYWHSRPGQWKHDYRRALLLTAAGYKMYTLMDSDVVFNVYGALQQIPELNNPSKHGGAINVSGTRPDPVAALRARLRKWPKVVKIHFRGDATFSRAGTVLSRYRAAASKTKQQYARDFIFSQDQMDPELVEAYQTYGQQWKQYMEDLGAFFTKYPSAKTTSATEWAYYTRWRNWWSRYGRS